MLSRRDVLKSGAAGTLVGTPILVDRNTSVATASGLALTNQPQLGELRWSFFHAGTTGSSADISNQRVSIADVGYLLLSKDELAMAEYATLEIKWRQSFSSDIDYVHRLPDFGSNSSRMLEVQLSDFETNYVDTLSGEVLWSIQGRGTGGVAHGDLLVSTGGRMDSYGVAVQNLRDGTVRWSAPATWDGLGKIAEIYEHGVTCVMGDLITMHDLRSGEVQWTYSLGSLLRHHKTDSGVLLLGSNDVILLDSKSGKTIWQMALEGAKNVIVNKPGFLAIQGDRLITGIDTETGSILWQSPNDYDNNLRYTIENQKILEINFDNNVVLYCSGITGELLFHADQSTTVRSSSSHYLVTDDNTGYLIDRDKATVKFLIEFPAPPSSLTVAFTDSWLVYVDETGVHRVDLTSGEDTLLITGIEDPALLFGDSVVVRSVTPTIYSLATGEIWAQPEIGGLEFSSRKHGDMLYLFDRKTVVGLNLIKEEVVFYRERPGFPIDFAGGTGFVFQNGSTLWYKADSGDDQYKLYAIDKDGNDVWSFAPVIEDFNYIFYMNGDSEELWLFNDSAINVLSSVSGEERLQFPLPNAYRHQVSHSVIRENAVLIKEIFDSHMYSV